MFSILKNPEAASKDLAEVYVGAERLEETLSGEKTKAYEILMAAQVECFSAKPTKEFVSAKKNLDDISTRIEGCRFGQQQIKSRLGKVLQKEAALRLERIQEELAVVSDEEKGLKNQYLDLCAEAALVREQIRGAETSYNGSALVRLAPDPKFNFQLLSGEEQTYYSAKVEEIRQESGAQDFSGTIRGQRDTLVQERNRLERSLQSDPQENAAALLGRLIPSKPEPTPEAEGRKTSQFIRDYDKIGSVNYEEGKSLPYRSVGEIIAEREMNS